jgi:hypothetical protein
MPGSVKFTDAGHIPEGGEKTGGQSGEGLMDDEYIDLVFTDELP